MSRGLVATVLVGLLVTPAAAHAEEPEVYRYTSITNDSLALCQDEISPSNGGALPFALWFFQNLFVLLDELHDAAMTPARNADLVAGDEYACLDIPPGASTMTVSLFDDVLSKVWASVSFQTPDGLTNHVVVCESGTVAIPPEATVATIWMSGPIFVPECLDATYGVSGEMHVSWA